MTTGTVDCFKKHAWWFFLVLGITALMAGWLKVDQGAIAAKTDGVDVRVQMVERAQSTQTARLEEIQRTLNRIEGNMTKEKRP